MNYPIWILACTLVCCSTCTAVDEIVMRVPLDNRTGKGELVVSRRSEVQTKHWLPPNRALPVRTDEVHDTVEIYLHAETIDPLLVWSHSHATPTPSFARCRRLAFYDVMHDEGTIWVLYSRGDWTACYVYVDRVEPDQNGIYTVDQSIRVLKQVDSGFQPYLMETGIIFRHEDTLHVGFKTLGSSSILRGREHSYEFWVVEDGTANEIDDPAEIATLREKVSHDLDENRPRMTEQLQPLKSTEQIDSP